MPRLRLCWVAVLLSIGPLVPTALAGGGSAVLNVTARVVNGCSVATLPPSANPRARAAVAQRCAMDVPYSVSVGAAPPAVAHAGPSVGSALEGRPTVTRERGRSGKVVTVTVTY